MLVCPRCFNAYVSTDRCAIDQTRLVPAKQINAARAIGRFECGEQIAVGRTSRVVHALDTRTQKHVALKIFHGEIAQDRRLAGRLALAAKEKNKLDRQRFITVVDADLTKEGLAFIARDLAGECLSTSLHHHGARTPRAIIPVITGIARALSKLHWTGRIYEDLRPGAVMLAGARGKEEVRLLEPGGLAILKSASPEILNALGGKIQQPAYISPEQVAGEKPTTRSDLYVLGVLLYELLIGFPPFVSERGHIDDPVPSIALEFCGLADLARALLDKDPAKRPQAADAVLARLDRLGISEPPHLVQRTGTRIPAMLAASSVAATVAIGAYFWTRRVEAIEPPRRIEVAALETVKPRPGLVIEEPVIEEMPAKPMADAKPAEKPAVIKPAETKPVAMKPVETKPVLAPVKAVLAANTIVAPGDELTAAYAAMDIELGRALRDRGLVWNDLALVAPNPARQWGRWFKKDAIPSLDTLTATFEILKAGAETAIKTKTSTLAGF